MPAVLTRPKKKLVIENTFIEKDEMTTKVSAVQKRKNTEQRKKEREKRN